MARSSFDGALVRAHAHQQEQFLEFRDWLRSVPQIYGFAGDWNDSLKDVLASEGGNDSDPLDPGGRTSRGIIQTEWTAWRAAHPGNNWPADVWKAPQDQVEAIYKDKYWTALRCDELPAGVDYCTFDYGVNSGIGRSGKVLRRVLGLPQDDWHVTDAVIAACKGKDPAELVNAVCDERLRFLQGLSTWGHFGRGWGRRVSEVRRDANAMAKAPASVLPITPPTPAPQSVTVSKPAKPTAVNLLDPELVAAAALAHGAPWEKVNGYKHLFYIEGCTPDADGTGILNDNGIDKWNDTRGLLEFVDGKPRITFAAEATTEPGIYYDRTHVIGGPQGAALITYGYQESWQIGIHHEGKPNGHEALVQTGGECAVYRDFDQSFHRTEGHITTGWYGINQHSTGYAEGYGVDPDSVGPWSAGCLVDPSMKSHRAWLAQIKTDPRTIANPKRVIGSIVMPASWVMEARVEVSPPAPKPSEPPAPAPAPAPSMPPASHLGIGVGLIAAVGALFEYLGAHPLLTASACFVVFLIAAFVIQAIKEKSKP